MYLMCFMFLSRHKSDLEAFETFKSIGDWKVIDREGDFVVLKIKIFDNKLFKIIIQRFCFLIW